MSGMAGTAPCSGERSAEATLLGAQEEERVVLGSVLADEAAAQMAAVMLMAECFEVPAYRRVFQAILHVLERGERASEPVVAVALLEEDALEAVGGREVLRGLTPRAVREEALERAVRRVLEASVRRRVYSVAEGLRLGTMSDDADLGVLAEQAIGELESVADVGEPGRLQSGDEVLQVAWDQLAELEEDDAGVVTGFEELDRVFGGARPGEVVGLWGDAGSGTSALGLQWALRAALRDGLRVVYFSTQMESTEIGSRLMEMHVGLSAREGEAARMELLRARRQLEGMRLHVCADPALSPLDVVVRTRRLQAEQKVELVVVDGVAPDEAKRWAGTLRRLARQGEVPVVVVWVSEEGEPGHRSALGDVGMQLERIGDDGGDVGSLTRVRVSGRRVPLGGQVHLRWNEACGRHEEVVRKTW